MVVPGDQIEETQRERHCIQEKFDLSHSQMTKESFRYEECSFLLVKIASLVEEMNHKWVFWRLFCEPEIQNNVNSPFN